MGAPVTKEEIKITLWSLKAFKALEPDRLHVGFFQHFWPFVGNSTVENYRPIVGNSCAIIDRSVCATLSTR